MLEIVAAADKYSSLYIALGLLWLFVIVLGVGVWYYRRRWWLSESRSDDQSWTLADLRRMRDAGEMTEEEFQKIRGAMIAGLRRDSDSSEASRNSAEPPTSSHKTGF